MRCVYFNTTFILARNTIKLKERNGRLFCAKTRIFSGFDIKISKRKFLPLLGFEHSFNTDFHNYNRHKATMIMIAIMIAIMITIMIAIITTIMIRIMLMNATDLELNNDK